MPVAKEKLLKLSSRLYSLYEAQHTALTPYRYLAEMTRGWYGNPFSPFHYHPFASRMAAASDLFLRVTGRYAKPEWGIPGMQVYREKPFCNLVHF
jgi:poly(3-hydroxybutyrate) depolymerase